MLNLEQRELLSRMQTDNAAAGFPFTPLGWWEKVGNQFKGWFDEYGIANVAEQEYNRHLTALGGQASLARYIKHLGGSLVKYKQLERYTVDLLWSAIKRRYDGSPMIHCGDATDWGILTAQTTLYSIREISPDILTQPVVVADLGAGWGRIGQVLMWLNPRATYIIYDIPDSLIISHTHLNQLLPHLCHPYGEHPRGPGIYFLGSQELAGAEPADYLITIATTQEMEPAHISAYLDLIEKRTKWFYTLQRRVTGQHYRKHWKEHFNCSPLWADYHFEALFELC